MVVFRREDGFLFRLEVVVPVPAGRVPVFAVDDGAAVVVEPGTRPGLPLGAVGDGVGFAVSREVREADLEPVFRVVRLGFWVTVLAGSLPVFLVAAVEVWRAGFAVLSLAALVDGVEARGWAGDFGLADGDLDVVLVAGLLFASWAFDGRLVTVLDAGACF